MRSHKEFHGGQKYAKYAHMFTIGNHYLINGCTEHLQNKNQMVGKCKRNNLKLLTTPVDCAIAIYSQKINIEVNLERL